MPIRDMFLAVLVAAIWGGNFVSAKIGLQYLPPYFLSSGRFVLVAMLLIPFVPRPTVKQLRHIVLIAFVLCVLHFTLLYASLYHGLDIASSTIAGQMGVPFACLLGAIFMRDKLGIYRIFGMVVAFGGIVIVAGTPNILTHPLGFSMALFSAFCWGVANILMKKLEDLPILSFLAWLSLFAIPQLLIVSLIFEHEQLARLAAAPLPAWLSVAYTGFISTICGYGLWYHLIHKYPITQVAPFSLLVPLFGVIFGQFFFPAALTPQTLIGGAITILGVAIIVIRRPKIVTIAEST